MIDRPDHLSAIRAALERSRIVALTGPRQCGKTTLARQLLPEDSVNYFDLEDPVSIARLDEPMTALRELKGLVVIDEVQRRPDLFPVLRVLADKVEAVPLTAVVKGCRDFFPKTNDPLVMKRIMQKKPKLRARRTRKPQAESEAVDLLRS